MANSVFNLFWRKNKINMSAHDLKLYKYIKKKLDNGDILEKKLIQWYNSIKFIYK